MDNKSIITEGFWRRAILPANATIGEAIRNLNEAAFKIILVINKIGMLEGTISDGDIRRGLIKGLGLGSPMASIIHRNPLVVTAEMDRELVVQLMMINKIQQIPIVDANNYVIGLHLWDEVTAPLKRENLMVIMAGGMGKRLSPHTDNCPKPLLLAGDKPILEHIINRSKLDGFYHFILATHYLAHMIEDYFGNGERLGVQIDYLRENSPLGTAGALSLLGAAPCDPFVVTNGDVIAEVRYGEILDYHIKHGANATMAVREHEWGNPFGVVETEGIEIVGFQEKPIIRSRINAGIYVLNPEALSVLNIGLHCDMPTLFERLQSKGMRTVAYPIHEPWLDVGRADDLAEAHLRIPPETL